MALESDSHRRCITAYGPRRRLLLVMRLGTEPRRSPRQLLRMVTSEIPKYNEHVQLLNTNGN
uniref:Uncharacterized protein n=1 Tax=Hyaloperonospora arabidopsidis (strain Emoy2) TaxID=559515 RepID=M4B4W4_HYAAE